MVGKILGRIEHPREAFPACAGGRFTRPVSRADHFVPGSLVIGPDRLFDFRVTDNEKRQRCILPPDGADVPASRTFRIKAAGTGSGFNRRIERVVCIISKRTDTSSDMAPSTDRAFTRY